MEYGIQNATNEQTTLFSCAEQTAKPKRVSVPIFRVVLVKEGKRVFVPAGETEHSIAATAIFSQKLIVVKPNTSVNVDVRLTIPAETPTTTACNSRLAKPTATV